MSSQKFLRYPWYLRLSSLLRVAWERLKERTRKDRADYQEHWDDWQI